MAEPTSPEQPKPTLRERYSPVRHIVKPLMQRLKGNPDRQPMQKAAFLAAEAAHKETEKAEELSMYDGLTGLPNRRWFDAELARRTKTADREAQENKKRKDAGEPLKPAPMLFIIIGDIDRFKQFNDTYGHQNGDKALQLIKGIPTRPNEPLARYGGEEFGQIVNESITEEQLILLFKRYQEAMEKLSTPFLADINGDDENPERKNITFSFGVTRYIPGEDPAVALKRADEALYKAKQWGRDRAVFAREVDGELTYRDLSQRAA